MNATARPSDGKCRRRIRYVDAALQRWVLLVVALEAVAVAVSVGLLYSRLNGLIEANLYRVHMSADVSIIGVLFHDGFALLGVFVAANLVALMAATLIWGRYVGSILGHFVGLIHNTGGLDFSADPPADRRHEVLALAEKWRDKERTRLTAIREAMVNLDPAQAGPRTVEHALRRVNELLR